MSNFKITICNKNNLPTIKDANSLYIVTSSTEGEYCSILYNEQEWSSKDYIDDLINICVTKEEFDDTKSKAESAVQEDNLKTINTESLIGKGNITIDLSLFKLVEELPTENINPNKIYLVPNTTTRSQNVYNEYIYDEVNKDWELLGTYSAEIDLSEYLKTADADAKYMKLDNGKATISISNNGSMNNYGDNGQAFNAVRECPNSITGYKLNAGSFGVKLDGTTAFSHKKYDTFNSATGAYTGAKNTAVLVFSGPTGLRYAKNTGSASDVTEEMYRYVGVIDSPDEKQRVYSKTQVDNLISQIKTVLTSLGATQDQIDSIKI